MRILILGDGNFSFTLSLCRLLWGTHRRKAGSLLLSCAPDEEYDMSVAFEYLGISKESSVERSQNAQQQLYNDETIQIIATSFDSREQLLSKYQETKEILPNIEKYGSGRVQLLHGINAWELAKHFGSSADSLKEGEGVDETMPLGKMSFDIVGEFDKVFMFNVPVWNHPHLGTEDFRLHRFLMAHFFKSVLDILRRNEQGVCVGRVCISLVYGQHERWDLINQASRFQLHSDKMLDFIPDKWPGYSVKRNKHGKSFKNEPTKRQHGNAMCSVAFRFHFTPSQAPSPVSFDPLPTYNDERPKVSPAPIVEKPFVCVECSRSFSSEAGRKNHIHSVHVLKKCGEDWQHDGPRKYVCETCGKGFRRKDDLWQHTINKHSHIQEDELPELKNITQSNETQQPVRDSEYDYIPCQVCGQAVVKRSWGMVLHLETLKPAVGLDMACPLCENTFIESRALFQHYKFCRLKLKEE